MTGKKLWVTAVALVAVIAVGVAVWSGCGAKTVAKINGTSISQDELDRLVDRELAMYPQGMFPPGKEGDARKQQMKKDALNRLIDKTIMMQQAEKMGVAVPDSEVEKQIQDIKTRFPSEKQFNEALAKQKWTIEDLKDNIRNSVTVQRLMDKISPATKISDKDALDFYKKNKKVTFYSQEQIHAKHILVKNLKSAQDVESQLDKGKDFATLAKKYSTDPGSKNKGGDLGWSSLGSLVPEFEKAALALGKNEISKPVKSKFGYHIIQLLEKKQGRQIPYKEVKEQIKSMLSGQKRQEKLQKWIQEMKKKAEVNIEDSSLK